jgi:4-amino-4-deoxy-L-arabinose transferase-like glycosyltransferase
MQSQPDVTKPASAMPGLIFRQFSALLPFSVFLGLASAGFLNHPRLNDEAFYLPLITQYADQPILAPIWNMNQAVSSSGPVYYMVLGIWTSIFGLDDVQVRWFSIICMTIASVFWYGIGRELGLKHPGLHAFTFFVLPFHTTVSICALSEPVLLPFELAGIYTWLLGLRHTKNDRHEAARLCFCLCGILLGIAINTKPPAVVISPALSIVGLIRLRKNLWAFMGPLLGTVAQIPFWASWGNIFPPTQRLGMMPQYKELSGLFPDTSFHLLTTAGLFLWPALSFSEWNAKKTWLKMAIGALLWVMAGPILEPHHPGRFRFAGPLLQIGYLSQIIRVAYVVPFLVGWLLLFDSAQKLISQKTDMAKQALLLGVILTILGLMRSPLGFDRYVTLFLPFWYLAYAERMERNPKILLINNLGWLVMTGLMIERVMHTPG